MATSGRLRLFIDYSSGRRIDWSLAPGESILMTRGFGEHITRVTVEGPRHTYDVAALRESKVGRQRDPCSISAETTSVLLPTTKSALSNVDTKGLTRRSS